MLTQLLRIWYWTDPDYFDEMMLLQSTSMEAMTRRQFYICLDDGLPFTDACHGAYTADQADELALLLLGR